MSRTVVVSNRIPPLGEKSDDAQAGGLTVVLRDLLEAGGGLWLGWSGRIHATPGAPTLTTRGRVTYTTIDLTPAEHDGYYNGFSNGVLWPLLHLLPGLMRYNRADAEMYRRVNERLADTLLPQLRPDDAIWIQDYHLFPLAAALRTRGVNNRIGFFLHVPFPPSDVLSVIPGADRIVRDLLAADLVGFQTAHDGENFAGAARDLGGASVARGIARTDERATRIGVFPVEIDAPRFAQTATHTTAQRAAAKLKASIGDQKLILGVDRLDPSKGLAERLEAFGELLHREPEWRGKVSFLQIAAASRKDVPAYRDLRLELERIAGRINAEFGQPDWVPIRLVTRACKREVVAGYMRLARVGLVTPLHDGMNLVAKEFVAAQDPSDPGVLVLSRFAGAGDQLREALLVNPRDPDALIDAIDAALRMDLAARRDRAGRLWQTVKARTARIWGEEFLAELRGRTHAVQAADPAVPPAALTLGPVALHLPASGLGGPPDEGALHAARPTH